MSDDQPITLVHSVRAPPQTYGMVRRGSPKPYSYGSAEPEQVAKWKTMKVAPQQELESGKMWDLVRDMGHK